MRKSLDRNCTKGTSPGVPKREKAECGSIRLKLYFWVFSGGFFKMREFRMRKAVGQNCMKGTLSGVSKREKAECERIMPKLYGKGPFVAFPNAAELNSKALY